MCTVLSGYPVVCDEMMIPNGASPQSASAKYHLRRLDQMAALRKNHHLLEDARRIVNSHPRVLEVVDLDDVEDLFEGNSKRVDDYGHSRFGKRNEFDDYGHSRFGKRK